MPIFHAEFRNNVSSWSRGYAVLFQGVALRWCLDLNPAVRKMIYMFDFKELYAFIPVECGTPLNQKRRPGVIADLDDHSITNTCITPLSD